MRFLDEHDRLSGILNGIDQETFNPEIDPDIPFHFSIEDTSGKAACREALLKEMGLPEIPNTPVMGVVSRLSSQKGMDLMVEAAEEMLHRTQLIVLGAGDPAIAEAFHALKKRYPKRFAFHEGFHLTLAPRIYAGCDIFLMPSAFEPCGLGQLIAMRYGTIPVVRFTGGLADTVFDSENGFVFWEKQAAALADAVHRATEAYLDAPRWAGLIRTAMSADHSWRNSAEEYAELYERALAPLRAEHARLEA